MKEKYSKYIDIAIEITFLTLVLMAPLFFDRRISIVFSQSKATWIRALTMILLGLWATRYFVGAGRRFIRSPLDVPVFTYVMCVIASTLLSLNVYVSFVGSYGRYEGLITIINYAALFFITTNFMNSREKHRRIMILALIAGVVMSVYGIIQRMGIDPFSWGGVVTNERIIATIGQPNFLAAYLDMAFLMGLYLLFTLKNKISRFFIEETKKQPMKGHKKLAQKSAVVLKRPDWNEIKTNLFAVLSYISVPLIFIYSIYNTDGYGFFLIWLVVYFILISISIYCSFIFERMDLRISSAILILSLALLFAGVLATQSRGGVFGLLCGLVIFSFLVGRKVFFNYRTRFILLVGACVIVSAASFISLSGITGRLATEISGQSSVEQGGTVSYSAAGSRIETWTSAMRVIADRPVLGIGPEVIKMAFPKYETPKFRFKEGFHVKQDRCHNEILDLSVTKGILGLAVYLFFMFSVFFLCVKRIKEGGEDAVFSAAILGGLVAYIGQNQFSFGVVAITSLFWIMVGMSVPVQSAPLLPDNVPAKKSQIKWEYVALVWAVVVFLCFFSAFPYLADKYFKSAKTSSDSGAFEQSFPQYEKALEFCPYDGILYTNYGMAVLNSMSGKPRNELTMKKGISIFEKGQKADPYSADNFYMAGRAYLMLGDAYFSSAEAFTKRAIEIDPYYAEAYQNLGYIYEKTGKPLDAAKMYEQAFISNPTYTDIAIAIYRYYSQQGKSETAFKIFDHVLEQNENNVRLLVIEGDLYRQMNLFDKARMKYDEGLKISPNDTGALAGKGILFLQTGDLQASFDIFQQVMLIDPLNVPMHNGLGAYYLKKGDRKAAKQEYEISIAQDPNNEDAKRMLQLLK